MSDSETINAEALAGLTEQLWRRLGITQTFDKLLVTEIATSPDSADVVRARIAENLSGGAAKFWDLSFPKLKKDLERRQLIVEADGTLKLEAGFENKLQRTLEGLDEGESKVVPTPGVTLEQVMAKVKAREARNSPAKGPKTKRAPKPVVAATVKPMKRAAKPAADLASAGSVAPVGGAASKPAAPKAARTTASTPLNKLFTTMKLNRLLDALDNSQCLLRTQLGTRLELGQRDLGRFLAVTDALDVTRDMREGMVGLHWKGQELSRTTSADRRMALIDLVKLLRTEAEKQGD